MDEKLGNVDREQYELFLKVIKEFDAKRILGTTVVLVGSWCTVVYKHYFGISNYNPVLTTRDLDFLVDKRKIGTVNVDLHSTLEDLDFIPHTRPSTNGYTRLEFVNPKLLVEFLVNQVGRDSSDPQKIKQLEIIAQPLRFMNLALVKTIDVSVEGINITVPHPAYFGIHKLIVSERRSELHKKKKDLNSGALVLKATVENGEIEVIRNAIGYIDKHHKKSYSKKIRELINDHPLLISLDIVS